MLEFIDELNEARLFRGRDTLKGKSAEELARVVYLMFMMVEILRQKDSVWLREYVSNTMADEQFTSMRSNSTDLHNLIAVLHNQDKFQDKIIVDGKISPPILAIKRYFREILAKTKYPSQDRAFFKSLEDYLKITNSSYKNIRRTVGDWSTSSATEHRTVMTDIKNLLKPTNQQNDLVLRFMDKLHR